MLHLLCSHLWEERSLRNSTEFRFYCKYFWLCCLDGNPPHPQGFPSPSVRLYVARLWFTLALLWYVCVFSVHSSGLRLHASMFGSIFVSVVKQEGESDQLPRWLASTVSTLLPDTGLAGPVGRVNLASTASSHDAPLCSVLRKMRHHDTVIMDWWGLWASRWFVMQPNTVSVYTFKQRHSFLWAFIQTSIIFLVKWLQSLIMQRFALWHRLCLVATRA